MGKEIWFFVIFFGGLIALAIIAPEGGFFGTLERATSTPESQIEPAPNPTNSGGAPTQPASTPPRTRLTDEQIERKIASLYRELDALQDDLRSAKLREPASPYVDMIDLRSGNARSTDWKNEYLTVIASTKNEEPLNISNWYLESYVSEESAAIPKGDRILERWRRPSPTDIFLEPGESAYLMTTKSPIDVSFRENMCTGYLTEQAAFSPSLSRSCPSPMGDMEKFGNIDLDDDSCYDFVERIARCTEVDDDAVDAADLSGACRRFIESTFSHDDCVAKHRYDPFFDNVGTWHIYLDRDEDLWRKEREIIRLMDENDKVIDVLEY